MIRIGTKSREMRSKDVKGIGHKIKESKIKARAEADKNRNKRRKNSLITDKI